MASYSQDALDRLSKGNLIDIILQLQTKLETGNNEVLEEVSMLNKNFAKLESELLVTKKVNSELEKYVTELQSNAGQMPSILEVAFHKILNTTSLKAK